MALLLRPGFNVTVHTVSGVMFIDMSMGKSMTERSFLNLNHFSTMGLAVI